MVDKIMEHQCWGQGEIITAMSRRVLANATLSTPTASGGNSLHMNAEEDHSEDENLFVFIGRELDEREEEARREQQQNREQRHNDGSGNHIMKNDQIEGAFHSQPSYNDWSVADENAIKKTPVDSERKDRIISNNHNIDAMIPTTTSKRKREYSIIKSTTPRFSFQSAANASTAMSNAKSPMERHSISSPLCSSTDQQPPKKSSKRMHRHSFRQSIDRNASKNNAAMTRINNNMRELGFAPKFLAHTRASGFTNDPISSQLGGDDNDNAQKLSLSRSAGNFTSPCKQSSNSRRNKAGGYLIQNLRSLRNNDQRMAMRLRASSTGGFSSAPMARKRRRSSGGGAVSNLDPRQVATSVLDVTIVGSAVSNQVVNDSSPFGIGKIRLAYIHRYTGAVDVKLPCYSWIVLSQNVMQEQSIGEGGGGSTQLRFYNAIVIPPVSIASIDAKGQPFPLNGLEEYELPLPTIICANICEQYTIAMPALPNISFDMFL